MTQLTNEHFELHDHNKAKMFKKNKIKKIIDNDNKGWWDDTKIICDKISDIIYGKEENNDTTNK